MNAHWSCAKLKRVTARTETSRGPGARRPAVAPAFEPDLFARKAGRQVFVEVKPGRTQDLPLEELTPYLRKRPDQAVNLWAFRRRAQAWTHRLNPLRFCSPGLQITGAAPEKRRIWELRAEPTVTEFARP